MTRSRSLVRRVSVIAGLAALLATLLGACGPISAIIDTQQALNNAGYQSVSVNFNVGNGDEVKVSVTVNATPTQTNANDVARIVWQKFHERFGLLAVTVHGTGPSFARDYSHGDLVSLFGARNPAYDKTSVTSATQRLGLIVVIVLVVLIGAVVLTVVLVRRRRRGRQPPPWISGGPPWMQGGPGSAPGGAPPPPWMQQPGQPGSSQQPAGFPLWPPPQGPPPGRQPQDQPGGEETAGDQAPAWPPAPPPPPSNG